MSGNLSSIVRTGRSEVTDYCRGIPFVFDDDLDLETGSPHLVRRDGRLLPAGLDQQLPTEPEPGRSGGDDPALDVGTIGAAVQCGQGLMVPSLAWHQRDRIGRHVRRVGDDQVGPPAKHRGQRLVEVTDQRHCRLGQVLPGIAHRDRVDVDRIEFADSTRALQYCRHRRRAAAQLDDYRATPEPSQCLLGQQLGADPRYEHAGTDRHPEPAEGHPTQQGFQWRTTDPSGHQSFELVFVALGGCDQQGGLVLGVHASREPQPADDRVHPAMITLLCKADLVPKPGVVDNAVYVDGYRVDSPPTLQQTYDLQKRRGGLAWIGLYRPSETMIQSVAQEFDLHYLMVEDAIAAHQRPKSERYGTTLFTVLRPARYLDDQEEVEFGELHVITGPGFVVTIRHAERPDLAEVRQRLEKHPGLLSQGPEAILYSIIDQVVDDYSPVVAGLENDIDEIEKQLFDGDPDVSQRIYLLMSEVMDFQRAVKPLVAMMGNLARGFEKYRVDIELQRNLRDVQDHVLRIVDQVDGFRTLLQNALSVDATLTAQRQSEETKRLTETSLEQGEQMKRVSSWAAILFAPSLIGGVYGMNFAHMPELDWRFGYPMALGMMLTLAVILYAVFRRKGWL